MECHPIEAGALSIQSRWMLAQMPTVQSHRSVTLAYWLRITRESVKDAELLRLPQESCSGSDLGRIWVTAKTL